MSLRPYKISSLEIKGYKQDRIENKFFRQEQLTETLAVILPGQGYRCDMPLLYYCSEVFLQQRTADVLQLWADYRRPDFRSASPEERMNWLVSDGQALIEAGQNQRDYRQLVLVGKSLGTLTMAGLAREGEIPKGVITIWQTPLLHIPQVLGAIKQLRDPALVIGGSADPAYDQDGLRQIKNLGQITTMTVEDGNHSLEIPGDVKRSVEIMGEIMERLSQFLDNQA